MKLTSEQRQAIAASSPCRSHADVAREFGISRWYAWVIRTGRLDAHHASRRTDEARAKRRDNRKWPL
jgi:transposase-like protein